MYETEIRKLEKELLNRGIPFEFRELWGGYQIITEDWDVICHQYSYGGKQGLLEVMGTVCRAEDDDVEGYLTAQEIIDRL